MSADRSTMDALHAKLAERCMVILEKSDATAAEIAQVRQFLKDNNIEVAKGSKRLVNLSDKLADVLPFPSAAEG